MNWDYLQPVKIYFGKGRVQEIKKIAQELGCARGLLDLSFLKVDWQKKL